MHWIFYLYSKCISFFFPVRKSLRESVVSSPGCANIAHVRGLLANHRDLGISWVCGPSRERLQADAAFGSGSRTGKVLENADYALTPSRGIPG